MSKEKDRISNALKYILIGMRQLTHAAKEGNPKAMKAIKKMSEAIEILKQEQ